MTCSTLQPFYIRGFLRPNRRKKVTIGNEYANIKRKSLGNIKWTFSRLAEKIPGKFVHNSHAQIRQYRVKIQKAKFFSCFIAIVIEDLR